MEKLYRIDDPVKKVRVDNSPNDLSVDEIALLRGEKLKADVRRKIAMGTRNETVLWKCVRDKAISVVLACKKNQNLTPEMMEEIVQKEASKNKMDEARRQLQKESSGCGCVWLFIIISIIGCLVPLVG